MSEPKGPRVERTWENWGVDIYRTVPYHSYKEVGETVRRFKVLSFIGGVKLKLESLLTGW